MQLTEDGTQLIVSVNSEHQVLASVAFTVSAGVGKKRAQKEVGFVVVNGVGTFKAVSTSTASAVTAATVRNTSGSGTLVTQATAVPTQGYPAPTVVVPTSKQEVTQGYVAPDAIPPDKGSSFSRVCRSSQCCPSFNQILEHSRQCCL
ncbi:hypothetical protein BCR33DRAFT_245958 [Rhizoclosmatium globosum]|uniref:Uncharacterized protein n=1 Tax=Rhizoclosmatium globosum TaxID=329046 RepID=A0A1Y2C9U7_9FUNG|nr:hypothetical protein BCR33DRAFT_245958 [Rhizoclosmatium globosum]|eukprot:ORY43677.1 hypothetical protein BCR33DRAFT_245958 [Rhizoclosmatium globosum]